GCAGRRCPPAAPRRRRGPCPPGRRWGRRRSARRVGRRTPSSPWSRPKATVGAVRGPELQYEVVDVFAPRAFAGNPLAVVFDADELSTEQCQALANEFHLSETSFLCAPTEPGADYRVRIFTPYSELPFAGHPS